MADPTNSFLIPQGAVSSMQWMHCDISKTEHSSSSGYGVALIAHAEKEKIQSLDVTIFQGDLKSESVHVSLPQECSQIQFQLRHKQFVDLTIIGSTQSTGIIFQIQEKSIDIIFEESGDHLTCAAAKAAHLNKL